MHAVPLLIVSAPGAHGALLGAMLGRHPQAAPLPELNLHLGDTVDDLIGLYEVTQADLSDGLLRAVAQHFYGEQSDAAVEAARNWVRRRGGQPVAMLFEELAARLAPRLPVLAESGAGWRIEYLRRWFDHSPGIRVLHLVRHPRIQCAEVARRLGGQLFVPPDYRDYGSQPIVIDPQLAWYRINSNISQATAALPVEQVRRLAVEDLLAAPEPVLQTLCHWLGLSCTPTDLQRLLTPEAGSFSRIGPSGAPGGLEPDFLEAPRFLGQLRPRVALEGPADWRGDGVAMAAEVVTLARTFGYR